MKNHTLSIIPLLLLLLGCGAEGTITESVAPDSINSNVENSNAKLNPIKDLPKEYPMGYQEAGLPMWDKATVERANKIQNTKEARYQVILSSQEKIEDIEKYYKTSMKKAGWEDAQTAMEGQQQDRRTMLFKKENKQIMMNVLSIPNQEKRVITIMFPQTVS